MARSSEKRNVEEGKPPERRSMLELRLPSDERYLHMVRELARRLAESTGFAPAEAEEIALAVDEATTNVIKHAYHGAKDREIDIHFDPEGESLNIQIFHDGDPLNEVHLPDFDLKEMVAKRRRGGLGVHIMKTMMDRVHYGKAGSGKNVCVMIRYKQPGTDSD